MKKLFKFIITKILTNRAKKHLKTNRTQVIAVTGSVGKTSTKAAIYAILKRRFNTYSSSSGFNTELGLSLAILQEEESGFSSPIVWLKILKRTAKNVKQPFEKLILEMGADAVGDIKKLTKIAKPKIAVITNVNPVHLAKGQFKNVEEIAKEKAQLFKETSHDGLAIVNLDDEYVSKMQTVKKRLTYSAQMPADIKATQVQAGTKNLRFNVIYKNEEVPFNVPVLGSFQIYVLLPAIAVGLSLGMSLHECADALKDFKLPPGRMNPIDGLNNSTIIDGSYNASPTAVINALNLLKVISKDRKIAALGTMNELGDMTKEAHLKIGQKAAETADVLISVGQEANTIKAGALKAGMEEKNIYTFFDSEDAGYFLEKNLKPKDVVLAKGSQNKVRMEKMVKICMAHPEKAKDLLCRQGKAWEKI